MKKLYMLMAALLIASASFAQIETKGFRQENVKLGERPVFKHQNSSKSGAASAWIDYVNTIYTYFATEPTGSDYAIGRIAVDSNGLTYYSDGDTGHGFFFGWGQTYDFTHTVWDDIASDGELSLNYTNTYHIDSVAILAHYNRGQYVPATAVDTLIVGITSAIVEEDDLVSLTINTTGVNVAEFYGVEYDPATGLQKNTTIYKLPLTSEDVSTVDEEGYIYASYYALPVDLNVSNKIVNITYTLKRDANNVVPMDSNIKDYSYLYGWIAKDPRSDYFPYADGVGWFQPSDEILHNHNQGTIVQEDNLTQSDPSAWYCKYLYPATIWNANTSYPDIMVKLSCNDCAIVNVPEVEKNPITVYPNPATDNFTVNLGDNEAKATVQLFNIVGQQVYNETITGSTQVNVANLHSGVYMLKVTQNGNVTTTKVVVK